MKHHQLIVIMCSLHAALVVADDSKDVAPLPPIKKGTTVCQGTVGCEYVDSPIGVSTYDANDVQRVERSRVVDTSQIKPIPHISKSNMVDRMRTSKAAPKRNHESSGTAGVTEVGNLPEYYQGVDRSGFHASDKSVYVTSQAFERLKGLKSGDMLQAVIDQSIKASPSVPTPIRAMIVKGRYKGAFLLGKATLDRELKRILIEFEKIRVADTDTVYNLRATGLAPSGRVGLEGDYHTESGKFFVGELVAATAAGYADATIQRNQNVLGNYVQEPSVANAAKQGAVTALNRSADRFAEGMRSAPEWTEIEGYQEIQVLVQDEPTLIAGG